MDAIIAKIKKSATAEVWVALREYQGRQYVDVREYFLLRDDQQWLPTKKGIMLLPDLVSSVAEGVESLQGRTETGTVATVSKSGRDHILVGVREFGNVRYGDVRIWYSQGGQEKPSPRGITFRLELAERLTGALQEACERLEL